MLRSFGLLTAEDVELDESVIDLDLDGADEWAADTRDRLRAGRGCRAPLPPVAVEFSAVRDLDLVDRTAGRRPWNC